MIDTERTRGSARWRRPVAFLGVLALWVCLGAIASQGALAADTQPPTTPESVVVSAGSASPVVAVVSWAASTDDVGVVGYAVWRASTQSGPWESLGTTTSPSFSDETGYPDESYWYEVAALDDAGHLSARSAPAGPVRLATPSHPQGGRALAA